MRNGWLIFGMLLAGILSTTAPAQSREPEAIRVMTYNIQYGNGASLEEIAALIREQKPDFVALQEVDCKTHRAPVSARQHGRDFITELGYLTGMFPLYGKTIPLTGGFYGIGILSSRPYIRVEKTMLPKATDNEEARALLLAEVELSNTDTIVFACTHIDFTTPQTQMQQCRTVAERLGTERYPVIVGGDFNSLPDSPEIGTFSSWAKLCPEGLTHPADAPQMQIDYLWGYPASAWKLQRSKILPVTLSDHCPIVSEVELLR